MATVRVLEWLLTRIDEAALRALGGNDGERRKTDEQLR